VSFRGEEWLKAPHQTYTVFYERGYEADRDFAQTWMSYLYSEGSAWPSLDRVHWDRSMDFLQGAWPFGLVEAISSLVVLRRWANRPRSDRSERSPF
jgi:hypothetical protein